ncbi:MAG: dethiobiotin synthase [Thiogranum sp.]
MTARGFFVTGTDTGVGKTCVSLGLMRALQAQGYLVTGMKPVASGCRTVAGRLENDDALALQRCSSLPVAYEQLNPYAFESAVAPHLAARSQAVSIQVPVIGKVFRALSENADLVVVEGVGGWLVPINAEQTMQDVAVDLGLPVVLVVAVRLGCLNHALLTAAAIHRSGLRLAGWVANRVDPQCERQDGLVADLGERLPAALLVDIAYAQDAGVVPEQVSRMDLTPLLTGPS